MSSITPIPASRVSDMLSSQLLLSQIENTQSQLQQIETQVSTGQRLTEPSQDPAATEQAVGLNRLIAQKTQIQTNIQTNQAYLTQTDTALQNVSNLLTSAKSTALSALNATSSAQQRQADAQVIDSAIQQLTDIGNQNFNGRYLFGGSMTGQAPFQTQDGNIEYLGNDTSLSSLSDLTQLFQTNVTGGDAFGALSTGVTGATNLDPAVTSSTLLSTLNGGQGVNLGTIKISDGTTTSTVDLSGAVTVGNVQSLIEAHAPQGRTLSVEVTPTGLSLALDPSGGGNLTITEAGANTTAADLGILNTNNVGTAVTGQPLNPKVTLTTPLGTLLGSPAQDYIHSPGTNTNIVLTAKQNGAQYNGYTVNIIDDHTIPVGHETVNYDTTNKTITVDVASGLSTAQDVVNAINNSAAGADFTASLDPGQIKNDGSGPIALSTTSTSGGSGQALDQTHGLQITNGGQTYNIDISQDKTVEDLLNSINGAGTSVLAEINSTGTGIDVHSRLSGSDFSIGENGGTTATQLGLRTFTGATQLSDLNHGVGIQTSTSGPDFVIQRPDGYQIRVSLSGDKTIQDVINQINNAPNNQTAPAQVIASLAPSGNGIQLTTTDTSTTAPFEVIEQNGSVAAAGLGLVPTGQTQSNAAVSSGGSQTITGTDVNPQETDSAFNALIRLKTALLNNDTAGITRASGLIDNATSQLNLTRADLGAREQSLTDITSSLSTEQNTLQSSLSDVQDTDMAAAITQLTALQTSFTATLQLTAQLSKLTLINFL